MVSIYLRQSGSIKKLKFDLDFADQLVKGRNSKGNIVTKYSIKKIELKEKGLSTLKPRKIWFDDSVQRLNVDERGELLGEFRKEDRLLIVNQKGTVKTVIPDIQLRFDDDMIILEKWDPKKPLSAIYWEGEKELFYVKRFFIENPDKEETIISDHPNSYLEKIFTDYRPMAEVIFAKKRGQEREENMDLNLEEFIAIKGITAMGNQLTKEKVLEINSMEPLPYEAPEPVNPEEMDVVDEEDIKIQEEDTEEKNDGNIEDSNDENDSKTDEGGQGLLF